MGRGQRKTRQRVQVPNRKCVGCRKVKPQAELFRLAVEGGKVVPGKGKAGRGCWLCRDASCARVALKTGQIPRALKGAAAAPEVASLLEWMGVPFA